MTELNLIPYTELDGQQFQQEVKIIIRRDHFRNAQFQDGRVTIPISKCDFSKVTIENVEEIDFADISICFTDCYVKELNVDKIASKNVSVLFNSSVVSGKIENCPLRSVSFNNCILRDSFFLLNLDSVSVSFTEENIFPKRWNALFNRLAITNLGQILGHKQSYYIYDCAKVNVSSNEKEDSKGGLYRRKYETGDEYKIGYKLTAQQKKLLNLNLSLKYDIIKEYSETKVTNMTLNSLALSGHPKGKIHFENTKISSWYIHDFLPNGEVAFYNISPPKNLQSDSKIEFYKSNLDNAWFDSTGFNEYSLVSFYRTKFSKTIFTSCNFPKNSISFERFTSLENIHYPDKKKDNYYKDQYEIYLQLKMALEATGNFHEAQKLFAISNDALRKIEEVSTWDKFILWVNRNSNNHGLSIKRPLILFFILSIFFYILYLYSLGRIFNNNEIDYTLIGYYFSFIDLTHRNDFLVEKSEFNSWSLFFDYFTKVLVSFFIYQFVAAFRKYGKR